MGRPLSATPAQGPAWAEAVAYGALVFAGAALIGFVLAPELGIASGLFPIEAEGRAFFSWLTLAGVPYLAGLCVLSGALLYPRFAGRRLGVRAALLGINAVTAWAIAASIAFVVLG